MATGTGNLPHTQTYVSPFDVITSQAENETQDNIASLADGTGRGDGSVTTTQLADASVTASKVDFATLPRFNVVRSTTQTVASGYVTIQFNSEVYDVGDNFDTSNYRFTAPVTGYYNFSLFVLKGNNYADSFACALSKNGTTFVTGAYQPQAGQQISAQVHLTAGDYVQAQSRAQNSSTQINSSDSSTIFSGQLVALDS